MIRNKTKNTVVAERHRVCRNVWSKAKGLMFTRRKNVLSRSLVFEFGRVQRVSMHMMFVFYPIDVIFLDEKKKVVETKKRFLPFTAYGSRAGAKYVLEVPAGVVDESKTCAGDALEWGEV